MLREHSSLYMKYVVVYLGYVTKNGVWIGNWIYWQNSELQVNTNRWSTHFTKSFGHVKSSQCSLVVHWQRIYNNFTVTAVLIKSSSHSSTLATLFFMTGLPSTYSQLSTSFLLEPHLFLPSFAQLSWTANPQLTLSIPLNWSGVLGI